MNIAIDTLDEKSATTLELFFDLVFVFAITQVVSLVVNDLTWSGLLDATIILGILWWGWTNWTWVTNMVSLEPRVRQMVVLLAMMGIFIMAHAVPSSFGGNGLWLAVPYVLVTGLSSTLILLDTRTSDRSFEGLVVYVPIILLGGGLLIAGAVIDQVQQELWLAALFINIVAAALGSRTVYQVDAKHFAERHGLIMIIALGEAIIAVGATLADQLPSSEIATHLAIGLALAMTLYWAYFDRAQAIWENALRKADALATGKFARDVYTFTHFPMIVGIVLSAVALEEAFLHPSEPLDDFVRIVFVLGIASFLLGIAAAAFRAGGIVLWERIIAVAAIAAVIFGAPKLTAQTTVISVTFVLITGMVLEYLRIRRRLANTESVAAQ